MIKAFLFDLDGTLFDSSSANVEAYSRAFEESGINFDKSKYIDSFGLRFNEMVDVIAPNTDEETRDKIKNLKVKYYKQALGKVKPNQALLSLISTFQGQFKTALSTTARKSNVVNLLNYFDISTSMFDVIITGEDVVHGKPDPECYLLAMKQLKVKPSDCVIFEDSDVGVAAATATGAHVIRVVI